MRSDRSTQRLRIVVLGYVVRGPLGGLAWHHLQYVMGLARLGHNVCFVEDSGDSEWCCYDPSRHVSDADPTYGLRFATDTFRRVGLDDAWAYYDAHTRRWHGPRADRIVPFCREAELLLNLGGVNPLRPWVRDVPVRVLVDTDPVFTQIHHLTDPVRRDLAEQHTAFFSYAENFGLPGCTVPDDGLAWRPTRQPVVLEAWPLTPVPANGKFTTVMQWDSYPPREYGGRQYGMKSASFQPYLDLPQRTAATFELAIGGPTAPMDLLHANGWSLQNPLDVSRDPWTYQRYLQASRAEFSVAKHGYVTSWSGWFSERSAAYLASGRPVLTQDTGFSQWLPTGDGLLAFATPDEARTGVDAITTHDAHHCRAARDLAEAVFAAPRVLGELIDTATGTNHHRGGAPASSCGAQ